MRNKLARVLVLPTTLLLLAACGSNGDTNGSDSPEPSATGEPEPTETEDAVEDGFTDGEAVTIVVPTNPGGGFDTQARLLQPELQTKLQEITGTNVTVRVENAPGGDGRIGAQRVFESGADDNLVWYYFTNTLVGSQLEDGDRAVYEAREFTPIALWGNGPSAIVLPDGVEGIEERTLEAMSARSEQAPLLIGGVGLDREVQLMSLLLAEEGVPFEYEIVQGSGTADTVAFLLRGDIEVGYTTGSGLRPFVEENDNLHFVVSTSCEADPAIPDVPTIVDAGWPNAETICQAQSVPRVFLGSPEMPEGKAAQLSEAIVAALEDPDFQATLEEADHYTTPGGTDAASNAVNSKFEIYERYATELGY